MTKNITIEAGETITISIVGRTIKQGDEQRTVWTCPPMAANHRAVLDVLKEGKLLSIAQIRRATGYNNNTIRVAISQMRCHHGIDIVRNKASGTYAYVGGN